MAEARHHARTAARPAPCRGRWWAAVLLAAAGAAAAASAAPVSVVDATGARVTLERPAARIVSLAPHATELIYAAGAGARLVGAVEYSDYPPAARRLPLVGSYEQVDFEALLALAPDLVVGWASGNRPAILEQVRAFGIPVYQSEPRRPADIADDLERLGTLTASEAPARAEAQRLRSGFAVLHARYAQAEPVRVFYQVWNRPLLTVGGPHMISQLITLCGGKNVFGELASLAPEVAAEAVLAARPDAIVASGMGEARPEWLDEWRRFPGLPAVAAGRLYFVPPDLLQRATPRLLDGATRLCAAIDAARGSLAGPPAP